jgi:hypothetical protein
MEKTLKVTNSSELYRKIDSSTTNALDRSQAFFALALAERFVRFVTYLMNLVHIRPHGHA